MCVLLRVYVNSAKVCVCVCVCAGACAHECVVYVGGW